LRSFAAAAKLPNSAVRVKLRIPLSVCMILILARIGRLQS
jgi:ribosomal protein S12